MIRNSGTSSWTSVDRLANDRLLSPRPLVVRRTTRRVGESPPCLPDGRPEIRVRVLPEVDKPRVVQHGLLPVAPHLIQLTQPLVRGSEVIGIKIQALQTRHSQISLVHDDGGVRLARQLVGVRDIRKEGAANDSPIETGTADGRLQPAVFSDRVPIT